VRFRTSPPWICCHERAEMVVAARSFHRSGLPPVRLSLDELRRTFAEKLDLPAKNSRNEQCSWSGKLRPALTDRACITAPCRIRGIWLGVRGTTDRS